MNQMLLLALILLATFGLAGLILSGLLALAWHAGLRRVRATALDLIGLRLAPAVGALLVTLAIALPAFLGFEPHREEEAAGPWLLALAALGAACLMAGVWRAWRACDAARALLMRCRPESGGRAAALPPLHLVDSAEPLVAVVGAWRPRIVATESVRAACSGEEFRAVLAHEAAHLAAHDNLKLLLLTATPDALGLTPLARALTESWRAAAEGEADDRATRGDGARRLALASALIKVARLLAGRHSPQPALGMSVAADEVPERVRALLGPPARPPRARILLVLAAAALLMPLAALPRYALLHELMEQLVGLGR